MGRVYALRQDNRSGGAEGKKNRWLGFGAEETRPREKFVERAQTMPGARDVGRLSRSGQRSRLSG